MLEFSGQAQSSLALEGGEPVHPSLMFAQILRRNALHTKQHRRDKLCWFTQKHVRELTNTFANLTHRSPDEAAHYALDHMKKVAKKKRRRDDIPPRERPFWDDMNNLRAHCKARLLLAKLTLNPPN